MPHNSIEYGFIARDISWLHTFSSWQYQLATKIKRFDNIRRFLWGYANDRIYADKPSTLEHLKTNIYKVMAGISLNMYQKMVENYLKKINACNTPREDHLNDIVFHT